MLGVRRTSRQGARRAGRAARRCSLALLAPATAWLSGCAAEHWQSSLHPASEAAERIAGLWWFMFWSLTAVFVLVMVLTGWALLARPRSNEHQPAVGTKFIILGGVVLPTLFAIGLLFYSLEATIAQSREEPDLVIEVTGHRWWWEVRYPQLGVVTANEIHLPVGAAVRLDLKSADVIHSFWAPNLQGKRDMFPGLTTSLWISAGQAGIYRGQCAEYCGVQHALMAFTVIALPREQFDQWAARRQQAAPEPSDAAIVRGREVFLSDRAGCAKCHAIAGTSTVVGIAPDLTHLGSRRKLAAATIPNTRENLQAWITNPQAIKPGSLMPRTELPPEDLRALTLFLGSLD